MPRWTSRLPRPLTPEPRNCFDGSGGGTLSTLAAGGNDQLAWSAALGLVVLYGVVAVTASLAVFRTRDIVS